MMSAFGTAHARQAATLPGRADRERDKFASPHSPPGLRDDRIISSADVRFGSKADMKALNSDVRFTPKSRH